MRGRGDIIDDTRGDSRPSVLLNIERVLVSRLGFPPGVPPPHGLRDGARMKEEEDKPFVGVAAGDDDDEKKVPGPDTDCSPLPLAFPLSLLLLPLPPTPLLECLRRQDTRRTSVKGVANICELLLVAAVWRRGELGRAKGERGASASGDGGVDGAGWAIDKDRLVEGGAVLVLLPGVRGPTDAADNSLLILIFFAEFSGWWGWGWG